ncbi:hypothetical protein AB0M22_44110, partial [Nocardia sp. NPDC051756]
QRVFPRCFAWPLKTGGEITQIYEGTNQIQRLVMSRALLR